MRFLLGVCLLVQALPAQTAAGGYTPIGTIATASKPIAEIEVEKQIDDGIRATAALNHQEAVRILEGALTRIRANASLKKLEDGCQVRLGYAYLGLLRLDDALRSFKTPLTADTNCKPAGDAENCADAQYGLGTVEMYKGDFPGAARDLRKALGNFDRALAVNSPEEARMNKLLQQAKAEAMLGAAQFRTGDKTKAIETLRHSVRQLKTVEQNQSVSESLRFNARGAMGDAQKSLDLLLQN